MIPVYQTHFRDQGNCFEAALASILEINLEDVPDFGSDEQWLFRLADFLEPLDMFYIEIEPVNLEEETILKPMFNKMSIYHFINGTSPRGGPHACVGRNGFIIHDPHEDGGGLVEIKSWGFIGIRL